MKFRKALFLYFALIISQTIYAQIPMGGCGTDFLNTSSLTKKATNDLKKWNSEYVKYCQSPPELKSLSTLLIIPVVIHIIHNDGDENITEQQVLQGIEHMNEAFSNSGNYASSAGTDTQIQFCLAQRDPAGITSTGINRYSSWLTDMSLHQSHQNIVELATWDTNNYLNIRLVREVCLNGSCTAAGYSTLPTSMGNLGDGIVMEAQYFGSNSENSAITMHEIGHYFGLDHTFNDGCNNTNCLVDGDKVCDTPPESLNGPFHCTAELNSCSSDEDDESTNNPFRSVSLGGLGDRIDLQDNFLDYANLSCMINFTEGQSQRMRFFIENTRSQLLSSSGCLPGCESSILANFIVNSDNLEAGQWLSTQNLSENADTYYWYIDGILIYIGEQLDYQFIEEGSYDLQLQAINDSDSNCVDHFFTMVINVICPLELNINHALVTDQLYFEAESNSMNSVQWTITENSALLFTGNQVLDSFITLPHQFIELCLTVENTFCSETICVDINVSNSTNEICFNEIDDDNDGLVDSFDDDCPCNDQSFQSQCIEECQFLPDEFPVVEMRQLWSSQVINDANAATDNLVAGDIDGDGEIEVIVSFKNQVNSNTVTSGIQIISGNTGMTKLKIPVFIERPWYVPISPSIADLDDDGFSEIYLTDGSKVFCYSHEGILLWESDNLGSFNLRFVQFADFNADGQAEVYAGWSVLNGLTGEILISGEESGCNRLNVTHESVSCTEVFTIAADVLPAAGLELIAGNHVYSYNIVNTVSSVGNTYELLIAPAPITDGFSSVGDIDLDGNLDVIIVRDQNASDGGGIWVWDPRTNELLSSADAGDSGGIPFIGNVNNNCFPEIGLVFSYELRMYSYNETSDLVLNYVIETSDDSGLTGVTMFDFNQNGKNELIYRDETDLMILDGETGNILQSTPIFSGTALESPIILDVNGDGTANILVNGSSTLGGNEQLFCFESSESPWAPTRGVWNQAGYHVTNVNDDLSIPRIPQNQAIIITKIDSCYQETCSAPYNSFMSQATFRNQNGCRQWAANDLEIEVLGYECLLDSIAFTLIIKSKEALVGDSCLSLSYYDSDPNMAPVSQVITLCNLAYQSHSICDTIQIMINRPTEMAALLHWSINDFGTGASSSNYTQSGIIECNYSNNIDSISYDLQTTELSLLDSIYKCSTEIATMIASDEFETYLWSDGSTSNSFFTSEEGWHYLSAWDQCGIRHIDSTWIENLDTLIINLGPDLQVCPSLSTLLLLDNNYEVMQWFLNDTLICESCVNLEVDNSESSQIILIAGNQNCLQSDTINITPLIATIQQKDTVICEGEILSIYDNLITEAGTYLLEINDCDSLLELSVELVLVQTSIDTLLTCLGDSLFIDDSWIFTDTLLANVFLNQNQCDSIELTEVIFNPRPEKIDTFDICATDSILIYGNYYNSSGNYELNIPTGQGCDTLYKFQLNELQLVSGSTSVDLCFQDSFYFNEFWIYSDTIVYDTFNSSVGCDSIYSTNFIFNGSIIESHDVLVCEGDSVLIDNIWYKEEAEVNIIEQSIEGCDSTEVWKVTIESNPIDLEVTYDCDELIVSLLQPVEDGWEIEWSNGDTTEYSSSYGEETISVELTSPMGCIFESNFDIFALAEVANISIPSEFSYNSSIANIISIDLDTLLWNFEWTPADLFDCSTCLESELNITDETEITLLLTHISGCQFSRVIQILREGPEIILPNIFSPNSDGINDVWKPYSGQVYDFEIITVRIYDRWGNEVFDIENPIEIVWDGQFNGQKLSQGVYVYLIEYVSQEGEISILKGNITLVR